MSELLAAVERWESQFGGGMVPFDTAYLEAMRKGKTGAEASRDAVAVTLRRFVAFVEAADAD